MKTGKRTALKTKRILNVKADEESVKDWGWETARATAAGAIKAPAHVDLRDGHSPWARVWDQGSTGSCVGQAVSSVLFYHFTKTKRTKYSRRDIPSRRDLWMASKETDTFTGYPTTMIEGAGTYIKNCLEVARKRGTVTERYLPFNGGLSALPEMHYNALCSNLKIRSYHACDYHGTHGLQGWKYWLANEGPIVARLNPDRQFMEAKRRSPVLDNFKVGALYGGHAVVICGYDKDDNFLIRNSWGRGWGNDRGYQWVSQLYARFAFTSSYGVRV